MRVCMHHRAMCVPCNIIAARAALCTFLAYSPTPPVTEFCTCRSASNCCRASHHSPAAQPTLYLIATATAEASLTSPSPAGNDTRVRRPAPPAAPPAPSPSQAQCACSAGDRAAAALAELPSTCCCCWPVTPDDSAPVQTTSTAVATAAIEEMSVTAALAGSASVPVLYVSPVLLNNHSREQCDHGMSCPACCCSCRPQEVAPPLGVPAGSW